MNLIPQPHLVGDSSPADRSPADRSAQAEREVAALEKQLGLLEARLKAERAGGVFAVADLQTAVTTARAAQDAIHQELESLRDQAKAHKKAIEAQKQAYYNLPGIDKSAEWATLEKEVQERAQAIQVLETQILARIPQEIETRGQFEQARQNLEAFYSRVYERPLEQDPRLLSLQTAVTAAQATLAALAKESQP